MSHKEIDPVSGTETTGHDWNGIKELDTPVPRAILLFIIVTHVWAVIYWVLMPAWPVAFTYTKGLLGIDQKQTVEARLQADQLARSAWLDQVRSLSYDEIAADEALMSRVVETGHQLFGDNCAVCHGRDAQGNAGYPNLVDGDWLWGDGSPEAVAETMRVGVNATHDESRISQMPAFGRDQMLSGQEVRATAAYVYSLSRPEYSTPDNLDRIEAGRELYAANCAGCHGETGLGDRETGVPNLVDEHWIYGGDLDTVIASIHGGRQGHMPTWDERLAPEEIKMLALYVYALGVSTP